MGLHAFFKFIQKSLSGIRDPERATQNIGVEYFRFFLPGYRFQMQHQPEDPIVFGNPVFDIPFRRKELIPSRKIVRNYRSHFRLLNKPLEASHGI